MTSKNHSPGSTGQIPKLSEGQLEPLFRRLNLAHTRRIYQQVVDRAEKENWSYRDFLALLLAEEVAHRKQTRLQRLTRKAHFPFFKTIDEFDFSLQSTLRQALLGSYLGPDFVTEGRSLILYGKAGRGKTHLAVAIGYRAIQNGFETCFTTAAKLIEDLSNASRKGQLQDSLLTYTHPHVLVVDEVGYLTYGQDAANVLFHVVNDRHLRKRPMIFTTNKPLSEWGKVLHDEDLAAAILDRILERGRLIHLDGPSARTRHIDLREALSADADRARISGISVPEFPEPTASKFDAYLAGNADLSAEELAGYQLFNGKAHCNQCHLSGTAENTLNTQAAADVAPLFTDFTANNIGLPKNLALPYYCENKPNQFGYTANPMGLAFVDLGLGGFLNGTGAAPNPNTLQWKQLAPQFNGMFQTATLRNVDKRPRPDFIKEYMHNGYLK